MANTVSILTYTNTFGDWVNKTNALANEVTDIGKNNWHKDTGTLFLDSPITGLQVANNAIIAGQLQVQGTGSSVYIQKNLTVDDGQVYFSNTTLGLTNAGNAIIGKVLTVNGSNTGLNVANNVLIGGTTIINGSGTGLTVANNVVIGEYSTANNTTTTNQTDSGTLIVSTNASIGNDLSIVNNTLTRILQANTSVNTATLGVTGTGRLNIVQANTSVNTITLGVTGTGRLNIVQANTSVNTITLGVTGDSFMNVIQANTSVNTATMNTVSLNVTGPSFCNTLTAFGTIALLDNVTIGNDLTVSGDFIVNGNSILDTDTLTLKALAPLVVDNAGSIAQFVINRGEATNPVNANAEIRWSENNKYWDLRAVSSPLNYYRILTNQHLSDSISTANSTIVATAQAVKSLNDNLQSNVSFLQGQITSNNIFTNASYQRANTSVNSFIGTTGSITPSAGVVTFASGNGITTTGSGSTITINTAQDIRTSAGPTFNNLILTNALPLAYGGTGSTSAAGALTTILPSGTTAGYVLTTGGPGSFYWAASSGGGGGATPGTSINSTRLSYTAAAAQVLFTTPTYKIGANQLRVYINGVRQYNSDYTETSATSVTLTAGCTANDVVLIEVDAYYVNPLYANNTAFTVNSGISPTANTIQLAIDGLVTVAAPKASPSLTGIPTSTTSAVSVSGNTQIATTAFVYNALANTSSTYAHNITGSAGSVRTLTISSPLIGTSYNGSSAVSIGITAASSGVNGYLTGTDWNTFNGKQASGNYATGGGTATGTNTGDQTLPTTLPASDVYAWAKQSSKPSYSSTEISGFAYGEIAEIGRYIDFHGTSGNTNDFDVRFDCGASGVAGQGTLSVTAGNVAFNSNITSPGFNGTSTSNFKGNQTASTLQVATGNLGAFMVESQNSASAAFISFHKPGNHASYFGLDEDNNFAVGGWSDGAGLGKMKVGSLGVGTAASGTSGEIRTTNNITAYYTSDERLKENISPITNALEKVNQINGVNFDWTEEEITARGGIDGYFVRKNDVGVIAQEIEQVLPEAVATRDNGYKAVRYELIVPLLIEAIKDLSKEIDILKGNK